MPELFDPYRKWLGIPTEEQPAHHYRLLGLTPFEHDPDVIENAADQRMAHVRTFQSGQNGPLSQRILNELSAAKVCLLNVEKKAAYDEQLRAKLSAKSRQADLKTSPQTTVAPPLPTRIWPDWQVGLLAGSIASALILSVGGAMIFAHGKQEVPIASADNNPAKDKIQPKDASNPSGGTNQGSGGSSASDGSGGNSSKPKDTKPPKVPKEPDKPAHKIGELPVVPLDVDKEPVTPDSGTPKPETDPKSTAPSKEPPPPEPAKPPPQEPPKNPVSAPPFELVPVADQPVDLLKLIAPKVHAVVGEWKLDGGSVVSGNERPILQLPCTVPAEYVLSLAVERRGGTEDFDLGLVMDGQQFAVFLDRENGHRSGLDNLNGHGFQPQNSSGRTSSTVFHGAVAYLHAFVLKDRVVVLADGEKIIDWHGEPRRFSPSVRLPNNATGLFLSTNNANFAVSKLVIAPLHNGHLAIPGDGDLATADAQNKTLFPEPSKLKSLTREEKLRRATDLFARSAEVIDDRPAQFVFLREALNLAIESGNMEWAWKIAANQGLWFPVDPVEKIADVLDRVLERAKKTTLSPEICRAIAEGANWLTDEAQAEHNLPAAERLLVSAKYFAGRVKADSQLTAEQNQKAHGIELQRAQAEAVKKARETLDAKPDDGDANFILGKYYAAYVFDWDRALPYFAKCNNAALRDVALQDRLSPVRNERQVLLADNWYNCAQSLSKKDDLLASRCYGRARHWYEAVRPHLPAAAKGPVEKRLAEMSPGTGLAAEIYAAPNGSITNKLLKTRVDRLIDFAWKNDPPDPAAPPPQSIIRWSGWLAVPKSGQYLLVAESHNYIRLSLDGELLIDQWAAGHPPRLDLSRYLLSKPYLLRIEYYSGGGGGAIKLLWRQDCGFPERAVASDYLFLQHDQAMKALPGLR